MALSCLLLLANFPSFPKCFHSLCPLLSPWDTLLRIWSSMVTFWSHFVQPRERNKVHTVTTHTAYSKCEFEQNTTKPSSVTSSFLSRRVLWDMALGKALQGIKQQCFLALLYNFKYVCLASSSLQENSLQKKIFT